MKKLLPGSRKDANESPNQTKKVFTKVPSARFWQTSKQNKQNEGKMDIEMDATDARRVENPCSMDIENLKPIDIVREIVNYTDDDYHNYASPTKNWSGTIPKCNTNQEQFDWYYGKQFTDSLMRNLPNLEGFLSRSNVSEGLRAKMIDWMMEVFNYYKNRSDDYTFFKAVVLMDLFLKNNQRQGANTLQDRDVHLIGLTSIFLASKYEDNQPIHLQDLLKSACNNKYSAGHVVQLEWEITLSLGFNVSTPTYLECLDSIFNDVFKDLHGNKVFHYIRYCAILVLKRCLFYPQMINENMYMLAVACVIHGVKSGIDIETVFAIESGKGVINMEQEARKEDLVNSIVGRHCRSQDDRRYISRLLQQVNECFENFDKQYSSLRNLDKYFSKEKYEEAIKNEKKSYNGLPH